MEILTENKSEKFIEHNSIERLHEETVHTFKQVWEFAKYNEYQYNRHPNFDEDELKVAIKRLSLNERRKLKNKINIFRKKRTIATANRFYHYVYTKVLKSEVRIKLEYPQKYLTIMEKRKKYLKLRLEMEKALNTYKKEKGKYFILRKGRGQKLQ